MNVKSQLIDQNSLIWRRKREFKKNCHRDFTVFHKIFNQG